MKIVVVGGGSGGHITPVVAVVEEIWKIKPRTRIEFWTDKKFYTNVSKITAGMGPSIRVKKISAGKLRRYTNFGWIDYLQHFDVILKNIADAFRFLRGLIQSLRGLRKFKPNVIFLKGGYTGLPVGMAARFLRIPYVIHDSDAVPGLTNRVLSKKASMIATGMPLDNYTYPRNKARWTGIPVAADFAPVSLREQGALKKELGFTAVDPLIVITGGSLGAANINNAVAEILPELLKFANVLLVAGRERYPEMLNLKKYEVWKEGQLDSKFRMLEFSAKMQNLFKAADLVVSRAGASTMTELASIGKATIMVPNHKLPGKHQVKNAEAFVKQKAVVVLEDSRLADQPGLLLNELRKLIKNGAKRKELADNLHKFAKKDAAKELAEIILDVGKDVRKK